GKYFASDHQKDEKPQAKAHRHSDYGPDLRAVEDPGGSLHQRLTRERHVHAHYVCDEPKVRIVVDNVVVGDDERVGCRRSNHGGLSETDEDHGVHLLVDGDSLVILLAGGTKRRQQHDIATAQARWADYKKRRKKEK